MGRGPLSSQRLRAPFLPAPCGAVSLSGISSPFGLLSRRMRQVIHVLLTRPPLTSEWQATLKSARLACLKHAASVRPEPGSNSPKESLIASNRCVRLRTVKRCTLSSFQGPKRIAANRRRDVMLPCDHRSVNRPVFAGPAAPSGDRTQYYQVPSCCATHRFWNLRDDWLGNQDSNLDYLIQSQAGYRYPIPQYAAVPSYRSADEPHGVLYHGPATLSRYPPSQKICQNQRKNPRRNTGRLLRPVSPCPGLRCS